MCVSAKPLVKSVRVARLMARFNECGIRSGGVEADFAAVMDRVARAIRTAGKHDGPAASSSSALRTASVFYTFLYCVVTLWVPSGRASMR